jgi:FkbM family methyltransferase
MTNLEQIRQLVNTTFVRTHIAPVEEWLRQRPGAIMVDVGTNSGGFLPCWLGNGAATVHCFEPVPAVFKLRHERYGSDPRTRLNNLGISDKVEEIKNVRILNAHTLADPKTVKLDVALEDNGAFDFKTTTLDAYLGTQRSTRIDFIKLDVDGYEPQAVRGMRNTLNYFRPLLMIELSFLPMKLGESVELMITQLYSQGYKLCTMDREVCEDPITVMEAFPWRTSFDMIAVPTEHIAASWQRVR